MTILVVEQNTRLALGIADHAYLLETGRVVLSGPAGDIGADDDVQRAYLGVAAGVVGAASFPPPRHRETGVDFLAHQIASGLTTGAICAVIALALVMIFNATHHINFAQGEMAMFSTYVALTLIQAGLPYWAAFLATVVVSFAGGVLLERVVLQPFRNAPLLSVVVVFIALFLGFNALAAWIWGFVLQSFPSPVSDYKTGTSLVGVHDVFVAAVTVALLLILFLFFRFTPLGLAIRAAALNPVSARLVGIRGSWTLALGWGLAASTWREHRPGYRDASVTAERRVQPPCRQADPIRENRPRIVEPTSSARAECPDAALAWFLGCGLAGLAAFFPAIETSASSTLTLSALFRAFAGVFLGGLTSLPGAAVGGFVIGILDNTVGRYMSANYRDTIVFAVIVAVLFVKPSGSLGARRSVRV